MKLSDCGCDSESRCRAHRAVTVLNVYGHTGMVEQCSSYTEPFSVIFPRLDPFSSLQDGWVPIPCWLTPAEFETHVIRLEPWGGAQ